MGPTRPLSTALGGNGQARILRVDSGTVLIHDLSIDQRRRRQRRELPACSPCATINANGGGALFNDGGNVTLNDVAFTATHGANPLGGAVSNGFGTLT